MFFQSTTVLLGWLGELQILVALILISTVPNYTSIVSRAILTFRCVHKLEERMAVLMIRVEDFPQPPCPCTPTYT
jgi:hypothetical protein